jgi:hypothetical protein
MTEDMLRGLHVRKRYSVRIELGRDPSAMTWFNIGPYSQIRNKSTGEWKHGDVGRRGRDLYYRLIFVFVFNNKFYGRECGLGLVLKIRRSQNMSNIVNMIKGYMLYYDFGGSDMF